MNKMRKMAIDPGANGGIAWIDDDGIMRAQNMPDTPHDIKRAIVDVRPDYVYLEKVGAYMPGNSGPAAAKFARHCGVLEGILVGWDIPYEEVAPTVWQRQLGGFPKDKKERKHAIKEMMQKRNPHLDVTMKTADALGILTAVTRNG